LEKPCIVEVDGSKSLNITAQSPPKIEVGKKIHHLGTANPVLKVRIRIGGADNVERGDPRSDQTRGD